MKHTSEQIKIIAIEIFEKINFRYDKRAPIYLRELNKDEDFNKYIVDNAWQVGVDYGAEDFGKSRDAFLYIDDETGNPLYLHHSTGIIILSVNEKGEIIKDFSK